MQDHKSYSQLLAEAADKYPKSYKGYTVIKRGNVLTLSEGFQMDYQEERGKGISYKHLFNRPNTPVKTSKICLQCQTIFGKPTKYSYKEWARLKFCSKQCKQLFNSKRHD